MRNFLLLLLNKRLGGCERDVLEQSLALSHVIARRTGLTKDNQYIGAFAIINDCSVVYAVCEVSWLVVDFDAGRHCVGDEFDFFCL